MPAHTGIDRKPSSERLHAWADYATLYLRFALAAAFLSAVADRLGAWGGAGSAGVAWGSFEAFLAYLATINPYLPPAAIPLAGWIATIAEVALGLALLLGFKVRMAALGSCALLLAFAIAMTVGTGVKSALDASVFTASAGALLLAAANRYPLSMDHLIRRRSLIKHLHGEVAARRTSVDVPAGRLSAFAAPDRPPNAPNPPYERPQ